MLTLIVDFLPGQSELDHVDGLAQPCKRRIERNTVHPFHDLRAADSESQYKAVIRNRRHGHCRHGSHRRRSGGDLHDAGTENDTFGLRRKVRERRHRILPPRLRRPDVINPQPLGFLHIGNRWCPVEPESAGVSNLY